jgi:kynurenine formamidase
MENLRHIDHVIGEAFMFAAFPLPIRTGTGSPVRPVAILDS